MSSFLTKEKDQTRTDPNSPGLGDIYKDHSSLQSTNDRTRNPAIQIDKSDKSLQKEEDQTRATSNFDGVNPLAKEGGSDKPLQAIIAGDSSSPSLPPQVLAEASKAVGSTQKGVAGMSQPRAKMPNLGKKQIPREGERKL